MQQLITILLLIVSFEVLCICFQFSTEIKIYQVRFLDKIPTAK